MEDRVKYDFRLNARQIKQEDPILEIIEGRLVPRNLSTFEEVGSDKTNSFLYVDENGSPKKIQFSEILSGVISVVSHEPEFSQEGQVIFKLIGNNQYVIEIRKDGEWKELPVLSEADIVRFRPVSDLESDTVQKALVEINSKVNDIKAGSVSSINTLKGDINIIGDADLKVKVEDNEIALDSSLLATDLKVNQVESKIDSHISDYSNPHMVNKSTIGLENVDNTSDINKPISSAQQEKFNSLDEEALRLQEEIDKKQNIIDSNNKLDVNYVNGISVVGKTNNYNDLNNKLIKGDNIDIDSNNVISANITEKLHEDLKVTRNVGGYFENDIIPAGTSLYDIICNILHPQIPGGKSYVYWYIGNSIPEAVDSSWVKEEKDSSIVQSGISHYFNTNKQFIGFAFDRSFGNLKHVYQNDLTMFDLLPDFEVREVSFEGKNLYMYYVTEKLMGTNDKYEFLWN